MHTPNHNIDEVKRKLRVIKESWNRENFIGGGLCRFRPAKEEDANKLSDLYFQSFPEYPYTNVFEPEHHKANIQNEFHLRMVGEVENSVLSAALVNINAPCLIAEIEQCVTHPHHRGKGVMSAMVNHVADIGREIGLHKIFAHIRTRDIAIQKTFLSAGFHPVSFRKGQYIVFHPHENGGPTRENMILMEKYFNDAELHIDKKGEILPEIKSALVHNLQAQIKEILDSN